MTITLEQIMAEPAGRRMDAWVAESLFGYEWREDNRPYSTDIAAAWELLPIVQGWIFSKRHRFLEYLASEFVTLDGNRIDWPYALLKLKPEHLCRAALAASIAQNTEPT